jgi:predicted RNase H-like HicB family nuclease
LIINIIPKKKCKMDTRVLTAIIRKEKDLFIAECPEIGVVSQGLTIEEALLNIKEATELYLEEFPISNVSRPMVTTFEISNI